MDDAVRVLAGAGLIAGGRARRRPGSPAELARRLDPTFRVTPTIRLLSDIAVRSVLQPDQRDIVTTPPRTGKSQTAVVWTIVWALMMNPDLLVIVAAYGDDLAEEHSRKARRIIQEHGEFLGYQLAADKTAVKRWTVEGRRGGVLAAGIQSGITGMGADLLLIDDPLKGQADADSPTIRRKILAEYQSTLAPRVHPGGSVSVIQCVMGSMRLMTADGRWVPIRDMRPGERVACVDPGTGSLTGGVVTAQRKSGHDETMLVRTARLDLRVNARHPFAVLSRRGVRHDPREIEWRRAEDLRVGDVVVTAKAAPELSSADPVLSAEPPEFVSSERRSKREGVPRSEVPGVSWNSAKGQWKVNLRVRGEARFGGYFDDQAVAEEKARFLRSDMAADHVIDVDRAWLIGYMIGDGWVTLHSRRNQGGAVSGCVCIALSDKPHFDRRARYELERWSPNRVYETDVRYLRTDWTEGARLLAGLGLGKGAKGKRVPEVVWSWPRAHRVAFLEGYCDADGSRLKRTKSSWRVVSVSAGLIDDVRMLALTCGVRPGRVSVQRGMYQPPNSPEPIESTAYGTSLAFDMDTAEGSAFLVKRQGVKAAGVSGVRGVHFVPENTLRPWAGAFEHRGRRYNAGSFASVEAAESAVAAKRAEVMGGESPRLALTGLPVHPDPEHVRYERITEIVRDEQMHDVFDITVEGHGNFVAEGFVVHNTRWHEADLVGSLLDSEPDVWRHTNVPAIAEAGVPDALGRPPGVAMVSALGYTPDHYAAMRRTSGERAWYALYQGVPKPLSGGLVKREWLEAWRLPAAPRYPVRTVVGVDPSDSGSGDSCGVVAASITGDGVVAVIADVSAPMTSDAWARAAVDLAVSVGASEIVVEGFAAAATYVRVVREALNRVKTEWPIAVSSWPPKGASRVGDAVARSAGLLQALEVGTCRIAGHLPGFEAAAVLWQAGKHQPDSLAAAVVAFDTLVAGRARRGLGLAGVPGSGGGVAVLRRSVGW